MKILVFDDDAIHRQAAVNQLGDEHELVVVSTYEAATSALTPHRDTEDKLVYPDFEIVLLDLLVLAPGHGLSRDKKHLSGQEMPLGITLAFLAIKNGIKRIGVITDCNHHNHPASWALDDLMVGYGETSEHAGSFGKPITIGDVHVLFSNYNNTAIAHPETAAILTKEEEESLTYDDRQDYLYVKNWKQAVEKLTTK